MGIALAAVGLYLVSLGSQARFGWYGYSPLVSRVGPPGLGLPNWLRLATWLVLTVIWASASVIVLRTRRAPIEPH